MDSKDGISKNKCGCTDRCRINSEFYFCWTKAEGNKDSMFCFSCFNFSYIIMFLLNERTGQRNRFI